MQKRASARGTSMADRKRSLYWPTTKSPARSVLIYAHERLCVVTGSYCGYVHRRALPMLAPPWPPRLNLLVRAPRGVKRSSVHHATIVLPAPYKCQLRPMVTSHHRPTDLRKWQTSRPRLNPHPLPFPRDTASLPGNSWFPSHHFVLPYPSLVWTFSIGRFPLLCLLIPSIPSVYHRYRANTSFADF